MAKPSIRKSFAGFGSNFEQDTVRIDGVTTATIVAVDVFRQWQVLHIVPMDNCGFSPSDRSSWKITRILQGGGGITNSIALLVGDSI